MSDDAPQASHVASQARQKVILIVDDSRLMRVAIRKMLQADYQVVEAVDGEDGWQKLQEQPKIDALFCDLLMPKLDGYGLLERMRSSDNVRLRALPFVLVTGKEGAAVDLVKEVRARGGQEVVAKPFVSTDVLRVVSKLFETADADATTESLPAEVADPITAKESSLVLAEQRVQATEAAQQKARREAELQAQREAAEQARKRAEEQTRVDAEKRARDLVAQRAREDAAANQQREAAAQQAKERQERLAAEEQRRLAELAEAQQHAKQQARLDAEAKAQRDAQAKARREAEDRARHAEQELQELDAENMHALELAAQQAREEVRKEAQEKALQKAREQMREEAAAQERLREQKRAERKQRQQAILAEQQAPSETQQTAKRTDSSQSLLMRLTRPLRGLFRLLTGRSNKD